MPIHDDTDKKGVMKWFLRLFASYVLLYILTIAMWQTYEYLGGATALADNEVICPDGYAIWEGEAKAYIPCDKIEEYWESLEANSSRQ
jgi:hypothetical protein|tara:strand:- start:288 stop:551 length:264 start_codon:yes stop_codon:yes gene_type:complete